MAAVTVLLDTHRRPACGSVDHQLPFAGGDVHGVIPERDDDTAESLARAVVAEVAAQLAAGVPPAGR